MSAEDATPATSDESEPHPKGTLLLGAVFLVALVGAWLLMYVLLLSRT